VPQVLFGGGDGYLYSFAAEGEGGKSKLLWKFDCNPKDSIYLLGGRATRNHIIATPVVHEGLVYVAVGEDPEHGEGNGHLWCIDPTKRGDVSPTLVYNSKDPAQPIAHKRLQALVEKDGDFERDNPNSAAIWHYVGNNPEEFETTMHRTCGTVAIKNDLLFVADFSGVFHCLDVKTGKAHWTYDMFAASWASPLIVEDRVYIGDEDGDIAIFKLSSEMEQIGEINMGSAVYTTPIVANDTLFIANRNRIFAIQEGAQSEPVK
jgi:outer membrane protein assembly factor BamB